MTKVVKDRTWTRQCPYCPATITYRSRAGWTTANKIKAPCQSCRSLKVARSVKALPYRKRQPIDLKPGQKFGKLEVVRLVDEPASNGSRVYECLCQCGRLKPIIASNLVKKVSPTQSCGCGKRGPAWNRKGCGLITGLFWASIVCGARERGHDLFITVEDAWEVFQQQGGVCIFTGLPLTFRGYNQHGEQTASLDRKDSTKPYTIDNIQWVHKVVNRMKNKLGDEEFIRWCNLISQCHPRQNDAAEAM